MTKSNDMLERNAGVVW